MKAWSAVNRFVPLLAWSIGSVAVGLAALDVAASPSGHDRIQLGSVFAFVAVVAMLSAVVLRSLARRARSVRVVLAVTTIATAGTISLALTVAANRMFLSSHDLRLVLVFTLFGSLAAIGLGVDVSNSLSDDLAEIASVAEAVTDGDFTSRTGISRADEMGRLARSIDQMSATLESAERERSRDDEARRHFFAAVGHDLRSPLTSLRVALEAVSDGLAADPDRYLRSMRSDLGALESLVDDIFLLARIESGALDIESVPVDIAELADEAIDVMRAVADRDHVDLRLETAGSAIVPAGPEAVGRVLRNLVDNAIRHAPAETSVVIEVSKPDSVRVVVRDEGRGFDGAFIESAFAPFTRGDPARVRDGSGSGLGLAIAHGFVTALGGEIWAEPGPGGVVGFSLPAEPAMPADTGAK